MPSSSPARHRYAGSSSRALANGAALLNQLETWRPSVRAIGDAIAPIAAELNEASGGAILAHGQGALWGGMFAHADPAARTAANLDFKRRCAEARVLPYFVPVGGFMLTPRYDDDPSELAAAVKDMAQCALETVREMGGSLRLSLCLTLSLTPCPTPTQVREMGWSSSALLPVAAPSTPPAPPVSRYGGPSVEDLDGQQRAIYDEIDRTRTTGAERGPFMQWLGASTPLCDAAQNLGRICRYETSLSQRVAEIAVLATAYYHRCSAAWTIHVDEARKAGVEAEVISALARGVAPAFAADSTEAAIYRATADLLEHKRVSADNYAAAVAAIGTRPIV